VEEENKKDKQVIVSKEFCVEDIPSNKIEFAHHSLASSAFPNPPRAFSSLANEDARNIASDLSQ
jgi:hypothetical protein